MCQNLLIFTAENVPSFLTLLNNTVFTFLIFFFKFSVTSDYVFRFLEISRWMATELLIKPNCRVAYFISTSDAVCWHPSKMTHTLGMTQSLTQYRL